MCMQEGFDGCVRFEFEPIYAALKSLGHGTLWADETCGVIWCNIYVRARGMAHRSVYANHSVKHTRPCIYIYNACKIQKRYSHICHCLCVCACDRVFVFSYTSLVGDKQTTHFAKRGKLSTQRR